MHATAHMLPDDLGKPGAVAPLLICKKVVAPSAKRVTEHTIMADQVAAAARYLNACTDFPDLHLAQVLIDGRRWRNLARGTSQLPHGVSYDDVMRALQCILSNKRYQDCSVDARSTSITGLQQMLGRFEYAVQHPEVPSAHAIAHPVSAALPADLEQAGDDDDDDEDDTSGGRRASAVKVRRSVTSGTSPSAASAGRRGDDAGSDSDLSANSGDDCAGSDSEQSDGFAGSGGEGNDESASDDDMSQCEDERCQHPDPDPGAE